MPVKVVRSGGWQRVRHLWGKVRRLGLGFFRPGYMARNLKRRRGECRRCGVCCHLSVRCPLFRDLGGLTECRIHGFRPRNCRIFPVDERDIAERDTLAPDVPCGYRFDGSPQDGQEGKGKGKGKGEGEGE